MIELIAWALIIPPVLALAVFSVEIIVGLTPLAQSPLARRGTRAVILVPAHDEELSIEHTSGALVRELGEQDRVLVVADNCSDGTAAVARSLGATVIERHDPTRRGKGFALAFGRDFLAADPPDVVVVLDADCTTTRSSLEQLIAWAASTGEPAQAVNLLSAPPLAAPLVQISNFAMLVKNLVRARAVFRVGGGISLFGTGMAFPWHVFAAAPLATGETVEDLELALHLADTGVKVALVEKARVTSPAAAAGDTLSQRRRWEHGFLRLAGKKAVPLITRGLLRGSRHQIALGLDLCVPPLALLFAISLLCGLASIAIGIMINFWAPSALIFAAFGVALTCTLVAWLKYGRDILSPAALLSAPLYVVRKIPLYLGFLSSRQAAWNRTPRGHERR